MQDLNRLRVEMEQTHAAYDAANVELLLALEQHSTTSADDFLAIRQAASKAVKALKYFTEVIARYHDALDEHRQAVLRTSNLIHCCCVQSGEQEFRGLAGAT